MCSPQVVQGVGSIFSQMGGFGNQQTGGFGGQQMGGFGNQQTGGFGGQQMGGFGNQQAHLRSTQPLAGFGNQQMTQQNAMQASMRQEQEAQSAISGGYLPQYQAMAAQRAAAQRAAMQTPQPDAAMQSRMSSMNRGLLGNPYQAEFDAANAARPISEAQRAYGQHVQFGPQRSVGTGFEQLNPQNTIGTGFEQLNPQAPQQAQQSLMGPPQGQSNPQASGSANASLFAFGSRSLFR